MKFTEEHKKRISEALKGRKRIFSKEWIDKIRLSSTGRKHSDDTKNKISMALKGKPKSNEHKRKLSEYSGEKASWFGRKHTNEERQKISEGQPKKENHHNWNGGITPLMQNIKTLFEAKDWRRKVFERDGFSCQKCNKKNIYIEAHHKKAFLFLFRDFLLEYSQFSPIEDKETLLRLATTYKPFWNIDNGETLCLDCHKLTPNYKKKVFYARSNSE